MKRYLDRRSPTFARIARRTSTSSSFRARRPSASTAGPRASLHDRVAARLAHVALSRAAEASSRRGSARTRKAAPHRVWRSLPGRVEGRRLRPRARHSRRRLLSTRIFPRRRSARSRNTSAASPPMSRTEASRRYIRRSTTNSSAPRPQPRIGRAARGLGRGKNIANTDLGVDVETFAPHGSDPSAASRKFPPTAFSCSTSAASRRRRT